MSVVRKLDKTAIRLITNPGILPPCIPGPSEVIVGSDANIRVNLRTAARIGDLTSSGGKIIKNKPTTVRFGGKVGQS